jgi:uncharacterized protein YgiM (DUF1202 family)
LGDVVTLIEKRGNGWWKGKIKDKEGWFPGSYVEETEIWLKVALSAITLTFLSVSQYV